MRIEAFRPDHLNRMNLQPAQAALSSVLLQPGYGDLLQTTGPCFSAIEGDRVIACSGVIEMWENRALAWALISADAGAHMRPITRAVVGFLQQAKWRRIEAYVDANFTPGKRWAALLGFEYEGLMRGFSPTGEDHELWAKVR